MYNYGGVPPVCSLDVPDELAKKVVFVPNGPRRLNLLAVCTMLVVPWLHFTCLYWAMCFQWHFNYPASTWCLMFLSFAVAAIFAAIGYIRQQREADPSWYLYFAGAILVGTVLAIILGETVFWNLTEPYYNLAALNTYSGVDPALYKGQMVADAAKISFTTGSHVDTRHAMAFKHVDMYCVAPITNKKKDDSLSGAAVDFWTVGINCCNDRGSTGERFNCGDPHNPFARSAIRSLDIENHKYYRLAVQQAEAAYGLVASSPVFVEWVQDPVNTISVMMVRGRAYFAGGSIAYFMMNFATLSYLLLAFGKMGRIPLRGAKDTSIIPPQLVP